MNQNLLLATDSLNHLDSLAPILDANSVPAEVLPVAAEAVKEIASYRYFEQYAQECPHSLAARLTLTGEQVTYGELNLKANQLAYYLASQQVQPQDSVGVLVDAGFEILIALLAIHKLNAIYLPIDPEFPLARIASIVEQARPSVILCASEKLFEVEASLSYSQIKIINLPRLDLSSYQGDNPDFDCPLDSISHIFFTSGTTGTPKGVVSTHRNLLHYLFSAQGKYHFAAEDSFLAATRFTFSISLLMLLLPLVSGGRVEMITQEQLLEPSLLAQAIEQTTFFHLGPSVLKMLLDFLQHQSNDFQVEKRFAHVKHASSGGDMIPPQILNRLNRIFYQAEVYAIYGSSEISCMGCTFLAPKEEDLSQTLVGKPFDQVQLRVLDDQQKVVPAEVKGEIYFAGAGITEGYLNLPELTQEKYVWLDGQRFYHTGDLGRLTEEGNLQVLGRADFQVQIRGLRIELADIESNLNLHPGIINSIVVARSDHNQEPQLVAYFVAVDSAPTVKELRTFLEAVLPLYMIPSQFVVLERFPLNLNGKIDRQALPAPEWVKTTSYLAPQTEMEQQLVEIWATVLQLPASAISVDDNFFALGGHSLLAATLSGQLEQTFQTKLPLAILFQMPTIEEQASFFEANTNPKSSPKSWSLMVPIQSKGTKIPLFLFQGVGIYYPLSFSLGEDQPVYGLSIEMIDDSGHWLNQIADLAALYIQEIKTVQPEGPYYFGGLSFGGMVALETAQQLQAHGEEVALLALFDTWGPSAYTLHARHKRWLTHLSNFSHSVSKYLFSRLTKIKQKSSLGEQFIPDDQSLKNRQSTRERQLNNVEQTYFKACQNYVPQSYSGNLAVFKSMQTNARMSAFGDFDRKLGWSELATGEFEIIEIPGDHLGILQEPNVAILAQELQRCMALWSK
ncbi:MAG: amino acid adenylation domain-containing protein [Waterburya sp.]